MKKLLACLTAVTIISALGGCTSSSDNASTSQEATEGATEAVTEGDTSEEITGEATNTDPEGDSNVLVAYYSATGNTEAVAGYIAEELGADMLELTPVEPYSDGDLVWSDPDSRVSLEHEDESLRDVALEVTTPEGWENYDTVFIGYPIWWGIAA